MTFRDVSSLRTHFRAGCLVSHVHFISPMGYHRLYQVSVVWIVLLHLHRDWIAVRRLRPYAHRLGRAQPPRTSAPRRGAGQALQPRQLHRDQWVGAAKGANVCSIFAVCVRILCISSPSFGSHKGCSIGSAKSQSVNRLSRIRL